MYTNIWWVYTQVHIKKKTTTESILVTSPASCVYGQHHIVKLHTLFDKVYSYSVDSQDKGDRCLGQRHIGSSLSASLS